MEKSRVVEWSGWRRSRIVRYLGLMGLICGLLLGCAGPFASKPKPVYFFTQEQAGSVQVGVQSVAPFEEYVDSLQPRFPLSEKEAFAAAITQTQVENLREIRALLAKIAVALPSTTRTVEEVLSRENSAVTSTRTETRNETPPAAPAAAAPMIDSTLAGVPAAPTESVAIDVALRYRAAAALFQDVALLSSYVREAAVATDTTPYIVRLLITVLPSARTAPYDAYSTVSFFLDRDTTYSLTPYRTRSTLSLDDSWKADYEKTNYSTKTSPGCDGRAVQVIPLFVTDSFESNSVTAAQESVRGFDGSLGGVVSNVGVGGGVAAKQDAARGTRGIDLNGIQTLAVTSPNTVQLRLGAVAAQGSYRAIPRTYNLTSLVLVPTGLAQGKVTKERILDCGKLRFYSHSAFRESESGVLLKSSAVTTLSLSLRRRIKSELGLSTVSEDAVQAAQGFDFEGFQEALPSNKRAQAAIAWPGIVSLASSSGASGGSIPLPKSTIRFFPMPDNGEPKIPVVDDGETARFSVYGAERLEDKGKGLHARLSFDYNGDRIRFDNSSASVTPDRRGATFVFPSIKDFLGKVAAARKAGSSQAVQAGSLQPADLPPTVDLYAQYSPTLQRWSEDGEIRFVWSQSAAPIISIEEEEKSDPKAQFKLQATTDFIQARRDGTGEIAIQITRVGDREVDTFFRVEGAILVDPKPPADGAFPVGVTDRAYLLSLKSLVVGRSVTVHSWQLGDDGSPIHQKPPVSLIVIPEPVYPENRPAKSGKDLS